MKNQGSIKIFPILFPIKEIKLAPSSLQACGASAFKEIKWALFTEQYPEEALR